METPSPREQLILPCLHSVHIFFLLLGSFTRERAHLQYLGKRCTCTRTRRVTYSLSSKADSNLWSDINSSVFKSSWGCMDRVHGQIGSKFEKKSVHFFKYELEKDLERNSIDRWLFFPILFFCRCLLTVHFLDNAATIANKLIIFNISGPEDAKNRYRWPTYMINTSSRTVSSPSIRF